MSYAKYRQSRNRVKYKYMNIDIVQVSKYKYSWIIQKYVA